MLRPTSDLTGELRFRAAAPGDFLFVRELAVDETGEETKLPKRFIYNLAFLPAFTGIAR